MLFLLTIYPFHFPIDEFFIPVRLEMPLRARLELPDLGLAHGLVLVKLAQAADEAEHLVDTDLALVALLQTSHPTKKRS